MKSQGLRWHVRNFRVASIIFAWESLDQEPMPWGSPSRKRVSTSAPAAAARSAKRFACEKGFVEGRPFWSVFFQFLL